MVADRLTKAVYEHIVIGRVVAKHLSDASCVIYIILLMILFVISKCCTFTSTFTSSTFEK